MKTARMKLAADANLVEELINSSILQNCLETTQDVNELCKKSEDSTEYAVEFLKSTIKNCKLLGETETKILSSNLSDIENIAWKVFTFNKVDSYSIDVGALQEAVARKVHEGTIAISQAKFTSDIATGKTPKKNIKEIPEWKRTRQRSEILKEFYQNQLPLPPPESRLPINVTKRKRKIEQEAELVDL